MKKIFVIFFMLVISVSLYGVQPPVAPQKTHITKINGCILKDDYYWLRDRNDSNVIKYIRAENRYTETMLKPVKKLENKIYNEIIGRIKQTDLSVPYKDGDYYYYTKYIKGKQYPVFCRKKGDLEAKEAIILDQNELAEGHQFYSLRFLGVSPDGNLLAYAVDTNGSERYTLYIKNLNSGKLLPERIYNVSGVVWANDNKTIFYTTNDSTNRTYRVFKHEVNNSLVKDEKLYQENDGRFWVWIEKTRDSRFIIIGTGSSTTSEIRYLNANTPSDTFKLISPRKKGVEYYVSSRGNTFYIRTNKNTKNFELMTAPINDPRKKNWRVLIPGRKNVKIEDFELFKDYLVVIERENGLEKIRIIDFADNSDYYVHFPEEDYSFWMGKNRIFETDLLRFTYTSLISPNTVYDFNMKTRKLIKKKQYEIKDYDKTFYEAKRLFAKAKDGTLIPISIVYKKGIKMNGNNPLLLYGYGAYGSSSDPYFSSSRLSLLDRGFIYAIAHVRGGGEMGEDWYDDGKLLHKKNTFTDFIACAEFLISEKYTNPEKLAIMGGSAGGMLIGAVLNIRPNLFKVAVMDVPFVDVLNTMLDPSLPLTVGEYEEWGNPNEKKYFDYIRSYSPYDNIRAQNYPAMLVEGSLNDTRVGYWEPTKWVAKLRATKTDSNLVLLHINLDAGHGGSSGRYDWFKDIAREYAFILYEMGYKD